MSPKSHVRTPWSMSHIAAPVPPSIDQSRAGFVGSVSVSTTCFAVPGPALDTVIVKPTASTASTVSASAVLTTVTAGQLTVIETFGVDGLPSFDVVAAAALTTSPQVAAVV